MQYCTTGALREFEAVRTARKVKVPKAPQIPPEIFEIKGLGNAISNSFRGTFL